MVITKSELAAVLAAHWLAQVVCDHGAKTDVAVCYCDWKSSPEPSVGAAVEAWARHAVDAI